MVISTQKIQIITEYLQKGLAKAKEGYNNFNQGMAVSTNRMKELQTTQGKWNKRMGESRTAAGRAALGIRNATHGLRGFRMEMLGVMFFGMALNRAFGSLFKTSLDWMGVTELMTQTLGILFLPVAELALKWALWFLDIVMNLTESQKAWIGVIALTGTAIGGLLFILGTFALGIGSLILVFKGLTGPLTLIIALFSAFAIGAIISQFDLFGSKTDDLTTKLSAFGVTSEVFTKVFDKIKEIGGKIISYISENYQEWLDAGLEILTGLLEGLESNKEAIGEAMSNIIQTMVDWVGDNGLKILSIGAHIAGGIMKGIVDGLGDIVGLDIEKLTGNNVVPELNNAGTSLVNFQTSGRPSLPSGGQSIEVSPSYFVTVSDKSEFESMLEENNRQLAEDVRRVVQQ